MASEKTYISENPRLMEEWNWEKNVEFDPNQLTVGSGKKVWWKCNSGHEWQSTIASRNNGNGCPYCSGRYAIKGENDLQTLNPMLANEWNYEKNAGLTPVDVMPNSGKNVWWKCSKGHEWHTRITDRNNGTSCPYCAGKKVLIGFNDLPTVSPALLEEWNWEKNIDVNPNQLTIGSHINAWWKCEKGHEWQATINTRNSGCGCPYCAGKKVTTGNNDLQTVNPTLAEEWNYKKNTGLIPMDVMPNSRKKVWWKCYKGHEWQASIDHRNNGRGCPYCSGNKVLIGFNDLQTVNPALAKEWNYENNGYLKPECFLKSSHKKVWWKCKKGHEWQATINSRDNGNGCPICSSEQNTSFPEYAITYYLENYGLEVIHTYKEKGYELDIYIPSKKIAIEYDGYLWHKNKTKKDLDKNRKCKKDGIKLYRIREGLPSLNDSSLDYVVQKTQKDLSIVLQKVLGEIIESDVDIDIQRDSISIENLRVYMEKENSLLFSNPEIANEWNYEKNANLKPEHYMANSHKKVWWKCGNEHEWQATIASRNRGNGCPQCAKEKRKVTSHE